LVAGVVPEPGDGILDYAHTEFPIRAMSQGLTGDFVAADTTTALTRPRVRVSVASFLNGTIVALAVLAHVTYEIPSLKVAQTGIELLLLALLFYACTTIVLDRWELLLLWMLALMTSISVLVNPFGVFLTDAKIYGLAVLAFLYFSHVHYKSRLILPVVVITIGMSLLWQIAPGVLMPLASLSRAEQFNMSRFGGFFLNAHFTAYFLATAFIYYGYRRRVNNLVGVIVVFLSASKFVFVSYVANLLSRLRIYQAVVRYRVMVGVALMVLVIAFVRYQETILGWFDGPILGSAVVILGQLLDARFYQYLTHPYPTDATFAAAEGVKVTYAGIDVGNEVALFTMYIQGGFILATLYLALLLKRTRYYRVFMIISLAHYGYLLSPLIVYMLVTYSREIGILRGDVDAQRPA
jgi:hypothetical protein